MSYKPEDLEYVFKLRRTRLIGNNLMSSCPFGTHIDDHPSFGINIYTGQWNCYSCGECGTNIRTLAYRLRVMIPDDMMMASLLVAPPVGGKSVPKTYAGVDGLSENSEAAFLELGVRGISLAAIKRFRVGYMAGSIIFPCVLPDGKMYGWIERNKFWDGRYGYKPKDVNRKYLLFGLDRKIARAFLVESMTDCLKLITWKEEAVSTCGNMVFEEQAEWMMNWCDEVVLVPQNDNPAKRWITDAEEALKGKIRVHGVAIRKGFKDVCTDGYTKEMWIEDKATMKFLY